MGWSRVRGCAVLAVGAALALSGCEVSTIGAAGPAAADQAKADARTAQREAVKAAVDDLGEQQAIAYRSQVRNDAGELVDLALNVTKNGTSYGALGVGGQVVNLVEADGKPYLSAPAAYWKTKGVDDAQAEEYGKRWMFVEDTDLPLNPSKVLTPREIRTALHDASLELDQLADPVRTRLADGTEVYELALPSGKLQVTAVRPHRVVSFDAGLVANVGKAFGSGTVVTPGGLTGDALVQFKNGLGGAVDAFAQAFDYAAELVVLVDGNDLQCATSGSCTSNVKVSNSIIGADGRVSGVRVLVKADVSAPGLGSQTCTAEATAAPNATVDVPCTVKFSVPNRTASYQVTSMPTATGEAIAAVDVGGVKQKIEAEFATLGG
ncbi:hypothetical protein [Amycolatopsis magusensis]|uniref:Lipoprotein n=1 Tax=Amycolatopsis magusensis TaxID=882444 RepID=A0ABS4PHF5_9PSEU|nr:hypothetical protein [Amycolatopsis magusensis]MBP2178834.1 hypothetical protein [Amycolatopsis magusensis]MDI5981450.1 hypothetical protein [Amycolatopsis magusensis]